MKTLLTASRMQSVLACPRQHFWRYEIGLKREAIDLPLRFGSAWHRGMEARWEGKAYEEAMASALSEGELEPLASNTVAALLAAYYMHYGPRDNQVTATFSEVEFWQPLNEHFDTAGKVDGLAKLNDGRIALIEHKTTGDDIGADSDYWMRLRFNPQILQYVDAARKIDWPIECVIYDVVRKPFISPRTIPFLDADGKKQVFGPDGNRVMKKDGSPRESGDPAQGWTLLTRVETPEEFGERLFRDAIDRPSFYFARKEVAILDQDLEDFITQRKAVGGIIRFYENLESGLNEPHQAWPRNISRNCDFCQFSSFCLQNISVDLNNPPTGFTVGPINEELHYADTTRTTTAT